MFSERFDALMRITGVTNSQLGRAIRLDSSHIGRFRSGARALPKRHGFLEPMCAYLAGHLNKDYQITALRKLTGIGSAALSSNEDTAMFLAKWLTEKDKDASAATERLFSGFSMLASASASAAPDAKMREEAPGKTAAYLYGNAGKRRAVEQFFLNIMQESEPQTLLLFSDEDMSWLSEDAAFGARWAELFKSVILKGNRVRIVHLTSRDMDHMMWSVGNWLPIYMTGAIEPYCYPRLRDGLFQRTMFIAPNTAAVVSSSVQQDTAGALNLFITDKAALKALAAEYERFWSLCRPLMTIFTQRDAERMFRAIDTLRTDEGNANISFTLPPLFAMPPALAQELAAQSGSGELLDKWKRSAAAFRKNIRAYRLSVSVMQPELTLSSPEALALPMQEFLGTSGLVYTPEQYKAHYAHLMRLERQYENLHVCVRSDLPNNMLVYVKEDTGALMVKTDAPFSGFVTGEKNMVNAFWDYVEGQSLAR